MIRRGGKDYCLGTFSDAATAALAYDCAARHLSREYAYLNFPDVSDYPFTAEELFAARPTSSRFRGVHLIASTGRWRVRVRKDGRDIQVGVFEDEEVAARAYDDAARSLWAEKARLNFP
jgi:hypothetical protein